MSLFDIRCWKEFERVSEGILFYTNNWLLRGLNDRLISSLILVLMMSVLFFFFFEQTCLRVFTDFGDSQEGLKMFFIGIIFTAYSK